MFRQCRLRSKPDRKRPSSQYFSLRNQGTRVASRIRVEKSALQWGIPPLGQNKNCRPAATVEIRLRDVHHE